MDAERLDIEKTVQAMTVDEKLRMITGDGMWHTFGAGELPRVRMADGPHGLRMTPSDDPSATGIPATCFPVPAVLANSWDPALIYNVAAAIGREATALGVNLLLGPAINIKRNPLCGRNFEYFSEDPLLSGTLGKAFIEGLQSTGVGACVKHFAANNREYMRLYSDSIVDERALREVYLKPFEIACEANPAAVMCAYNKLNGVYCSESEFLLRRVLRDEWHYRGVTISDWGAVRDRKRSLIAGLDIEMPDSKGIHEADLRAALSGGEITPDMLDDSLRRTLELVDDVYLEPYGDYDADAHDKIAYTAAVEGTVLLKNDNNFLPLTKNMKVAVMGSVAEDCPIQGGGSSFVTPLKSLTPLDAFSRRNIEVTYYRGYSPDPKENARLYDEALTGAFGADVVIVYAGCPAPTEAVDRSDLSLPAEQNKLIGALTNGGHRVVVVLTTSYAVEMPWIKRVRSVVLQGLGGANGALAAVDVLYGRVNPRGRLAETYPLSLSDVPVESTTSLRDVYRDSIFVGYRYYDSADKEVLFPFGHGLSFSEITYDDLRIKRRSERDNDFEAEVVLTNRSTRDAYETVQIYISDCTGRIMTPVKQLAGYRKVFIEGGTTTTVNIRINSRTFEFWNAKKGAFDTADGEYKIHAAASAADVRRTVSVRVNGAFKDHEHVPAAYHLPIETISNADFEQLYGGPLPPEPQPPAKGSYTLDSTINDISKSCLMGRIICSIAKRGAKSAGPVGSPEYEAYLAGAIHSPMTSVTSMSGGAVTPNMARGILEMANGRFFRGLRLMLKKEKPQDQ